MGRGAVAPRGQPDLEVVLPPRQSALAPQKRTKFKASCTSLHESSTAAVPELIPTMQRVILALAMGASAFENSYLASMSQRSVQAELPERYAAGISYRSMVTTLCC